MAELTSDCPRCKANRITFDLIGAHTTEVGGANWQYGYEAFFRCRRCLAGTIFILRLNEYETRSEFNSPEKLMKGISLDHFFDNCGFISLKDQVSIFPPEFTPENIAAIFNEGAVCLSVKCWNAASTMFRLCIDLVTRPLLPESGADCAQPNSRQRRDLGLRVPWLIEHNFLSRNLEELAACIREDANDGAHQGDLTEDDATDLLDFTVLLLERHFTEPGRLKVAQERRNFRRAARQEKAGGI